jgi:hypothetical protein
MTSNALALAQKVSVLTSSSGASTTTYANPTNLPTSGVTTGAMAYVSASNKLYMWNGTAWFNIAIVNQAPTAITGNQATYGLATDGTPTVVTLVSTDPEGLPLTWSSSTSGDTQVGTLSQTDNVFTITPSTDEANIGTLSVTFSVTDGNNTETSVSSFILVFISPYWNETVLSIGTSSTNGLANSTFIDRSTNAHTVTPAGTPVQTAFHPYLNNWGVEFTEDTVTIPTSAEFNVGNGNFTFETWINTTRNVGTIFDFGGNYLISYNGFRLGFGSTGYLALIINQQSNSPSGEYTLEGSTKMNDGKWNHIRITRTGTTFRIFVNGVLDVSGTSSVTGYQAGSAFVIGGSLSNNSPASGFTGNLADFRLIKGTSLNTTNDSFDVPTENLTNISGTSLLLFNRNRFIDLSSTGHSLTSNGAKVSAFNPFGQETEYAVGENKGSTYFDGSADYFTLANGSEQFVPEAEDFTFETWFYTPDSTRQDIYSSYTPGTGFGLAISYAAGDILVYKGNTHVLQTAGGKWRINQWNHLVVSRSGTSLKVFINGVEVGSTTDSTDFSGTSTLYIGSAGNNTLRFEGFLSDVRLVKGTALYTTNFTPPTAPVGNTNASLYLPMDNAGIFDKTGNNTLTPIGNASTSTTQTKYADTAMYFDGTGDYLSGIINRNIVFGTEDMTIECWVYPNSLSGTLTIFDTRQGGTNYGTDSFSFSINNGIPVMNAGSYSTTTAIVQAPSTINLSTWVHIASTRENGTNRLFIDGVSVDSNTRSWNQTFTDGRAYYIGQTIGFNRPFNGYIENLQFLKGVAKYTANFTVPDRTQGITYQQT